MLKPVSEIAKRFGGSLPEGLIAQKQERLTTVLLEPMRDIKGGYVVDVFAHGEEAFRVVNYAAVPGMAPHVSVDVWNVPLDMWVSKRTFAMETETIMQPWVREHSIATFPPELVLTAEQAAVDMVFQSAPRPTVDEQAAKWKRLDLDRRGVREQIFDSKAALAEFWYETKDVKWYEVHGVGHPYLFDFICADVMFRHGGKVDQKIGVKLANKVEQSLAEMVSDWRDFGTLQGAVEWISKGGSGDDVPIVLEHFGVDYDLACDLIFSGQHERALRELENVMIQEIKVSVFAEDWEPHEICGGELDPSHRRLVVEDEILDVEELKACARKYNLSRASSSSPTGAEHIWFESESPEENRAFFEYGVGTYYALHVHTIDGREPNADDYQMIADTIGVKFANPAKDHVVESEVRFG